MPFLSHLSAWLMCADEYVRAAWFHGFTSQTTAIQVYALCVIGRGYRVAVGACPWPCAPFVDRNSILVHRNSHSLVPYPVLVYYLAYRSALVIYTG